MASPLRCLSGENEELVEEEREKGERDDSHPQSSAGDLEEEEVVMTGRDKKKTSLILHCF